MLLQNCRYVVTQNPGREILEHTDVLIEDNRIAAVGRGLDGSPRIDCSERIVMPGLINAHCHLGMTGLRGISDDRELDEWLAAMWERERRFSTENIRQSAALGIRESLRFGTTCVLDMFFRTDVVRPDGIRYLGAEAIALGHPLSANGPCGDILGPHAIHTTDERILKQCSVGKLVTMHLSETRQERAEFVRKRGMLPVEYLDSIGFLSERVLLVHCVWLTKRELDIIARSGAKVVHCPQSNMKLASGGVMPLQEMRSRGITVALGTDGAASNNSLDMFREMHAAALLHKQHYWDPAAADAQYVLDLATLAGAKALGIEAGSIERGKLADIITLDLTHPNLQPHDPGRIVSHLVYAAQGMNVSDVIVDGKRVGQ